ncbi:MAG: hypothetical protein DHS80DRAFT_33055 [Piptocephalis tieghemiana]|nr:MAG: hypothetical protein DHS80DRAFT_33055 [Piptocephalis tieghemiana]
MAHLWWMPRSRSMIRTPSFLATCSKHYLSLLTLLFLLFLSPCIHAKASLPIHAIQATAPTQNFSLLIQVYQGGWYDLDRVYILAQRPQATDYPDDVPPFGFEFTTNPPPSSGSCTNLGPVYNPKNVSEALLLACGNTYESTCPPGVMTQAFGAISLDPGHQTTGRVASLKIPKTSTNPSSSESLIGRSLRVFPLNAYDQTLGCGAVFILNDKETLMGELVAQNPEYLYYREHMRFRATAKSDLISSLCVVLAFRNLFYAIMILLNRTSRLPVHWFCFTAALSQIIAIFPPIIIQIFPFDIFTDPCDWMRFTGFIFSTITTASVLIVQFFKARSANPSHRQAINLISLAFALIWLGNFIATCIILRPKEFANNACFAPFEFFAASPPVFWTKVAVEFAANLTLGICFIASLAKQRRITGLVIYDDLLKDGLLYSLLVCSSNIICPILYLFKVLNQQAVGFYAIDFAIATTLTVQQLRESRIRSNRTRKRTTASAFDSEPTPLSPIDPSSSSSPKGLWARSRFSSRDLPVSYQRQSTNSDDMANL